MRPHCFRLSRWKDASQLTQRISNDTRIRNAKTPSTQRSLWSVAGWSRRCAVGTESAWRIPLNELFDAKVIVFWEHVLILIMFLPISSPTSKEIPKSRAHVGLSSILRLRRLCGRHDFSSRSGTEVRNPTVVNVVLNIQPVISTIGAFLLFGDRLASSLFLYAATAVVAGIFVSVTHPTMIGVSFERAGLNLGSGYALICRAFTGAIDSCWPRGDDRHVTSTCVGHAHCRRPRVYDADSSRLWQTSRRSALASDGASTRW